MTGLLILLFMTIEILPVAAKLLSMSGPATLYERVLNDEEKNLDKRSSEHEAAVTQLAHDRAEEEVRQLTQVRQLLWERKSEAMKRVIKECSDDELLRLSELAVVEAGDRGATRTQRHSS
jgi:hypothetical protein